MFEKLVVSTSERRKGRTAKFFVCTSLTYLIALGTAFALSVLLADPKLADSSDLRVLIPPSRPPAPPPPSVGPPDHNPGTPTPPDPQHAMRYEDLVAQPHNTPPRLDLPRGITFDPSAAVVGGDPNGVSRGAGIGGSVIGGERATGEAPRPPDPPKPQPLVAEDKKPVPIPSSVLQGKAIERIVPVYPELPKRIHLQGDVSVEVVISPDGRVESARVVSGHPMLVSVARDAALRWRFGPTFLNGVPVRVTGVITFVFKIND